MQLKNPTRVQKNLMADKGLDPAKYQVVSETKDSLIIQHRETGKQTLIERSYQKRRWLRGNSQSR